MMVVEVVLEEPRARALAGIPGKDVHTPLSHTEHRALHTVHTQTEEMVQ